MASQPIVLLKRLLLTASLATMVLAALVATDSIGAAPDTLTREALCWRMILQTTEGRQGLVSSLWFAPLPTLLRWPLVVLLPLPWTGLPSRLVSLVSALAALTVLWRVSTRWLPRAAASLLVLGTAAHPAVWTGALDGGDAATLSFLALLFAASAVRWVLEDRLTHLVLMALSAALLCLTRAEMILWTAAGLAFLTAHEWAAPRLPGQRAAILILGLLPWFYGVGLWVLGNWLIMGDALYFLRSLALLRPAGEALSTLSSDPFRHPLWGVPILFSLLLGLAALIRREGASFLPALMTPALLLVAALADAFGVLWDQAPFGLPALLLGMFALARSAALLPLRFRTPAALLAPFATLLLLILPAPPIPNGWSGLAPETTDERQAVLREIGAILPKGPYVRVFVCGYDAFALLDGVTDERFRHALDFDFAQAQQDYEGHHLFLLVPRPEGRAAMESIHWKFPGLFHAGFANTLYAGDWGRWRLFELIHHPREEL